MAEQIVLADSSPLIGLTSAGEFDLLRKLFAEITITHAVCQEVLGKGALPGSRELADAIQTGWIAVVDAPSGKSEFPTLGEGEASTLCLAMTHTAPCLVIIDDLSGRAHANAKGLTITGLAGVLVAAKKQGLIASVHPALKRLEANKFRLSRKVVEALIEAAGES